MTAETAVEVSGLTVRRGGRAVLDGIDLDVARGAVVGLLGPSGSGKTTLLRSIVGVQRIASGRIRVLGEEAGARPLRRRVAYATQAASVYDDLTVTQNLRYFARSLGLGREEARRVADEVDLSGQAGRLVGSLSGGQRNRVSLAAAMLGSPELVVLDEPTVGLDPMLRESIWGTLRRLAAAGTTLLVSSHVMEEALRCDALVLLRAGRLIARTTPRRLLDDTGSGDPDTAFLRLVTGLDEGSA